MKQIQCYLIRPLSPLVFRTGKPFGSQSDASDILFPLPSSGAGLVRTQTLLQADLPLTEGSHGSLQLSAEDQEKLQAIAHKGPFLVELFEDGSYEIFTAKPADALYLKNKATGNIELVRLTPQNLSDAAIMGADLPKGLLPVMMEKSLKGKPQPGAQLWTLKDSLAWQNGQTLTFKEVDARGIRTLPVDIRTHVAIDAETHAGVEGKLFQSASYDFGAIRKENYDGWHEKSYGFMLLSDADLKENHVRFGGESRLSEMTLTALPEALKGEMTLGESIAEKGGFKLTLTTPGIFANGYIPGWINLETMEGTLPGSHVKVRLKACCMDRWLPVSGWDLHQKKPKAMRKAVSAGAVYWFELVEGDAKNLHEHFFTSISDDQQDQKDGFGIVTIAPWALQ